MNIRIPILRVLFIVYLIFPGCSTGPDFFKEGLNKYKSGNYLGSILEYDKEIQNHKLNDSAYLMRGKAENLLGKYNDAILDFTNSIELNEGFPAYYNRGLAFLSINDNTNAESDFTNAIRLKPLSDSAYYCRGYIRTILNKHEDALQDYNKAILL